MATTIRHKAGDRYSSKTLPGRVSEDLKLVFGRRLQAAMVRQGWNQVDMARFATAKIPNNKGKDKRKIGRDNIGLYLRGATFPNPIYLQAIAGALGMPVEKLVPQMTLPSPELENGAPETFAQLDDARGHVKLNRTVSLKTMRAIYAILRAEDAEAPQH